ncbi:MAG: LamG-like jellyroll fold domain-containing protein [Prolixibacteraceae bacterium]
MRFIHHRTMPYFQRNAITYSLFLGIIFMLFLQNTEANGKNINETSYLIGEFNDGNTVIHFLDRKDIPQYSGLSISVNYSLDENRLYLSPISSGVTFELFSQKLKEYLADHPQLIFPLFIKHSDPENWIIEELNSSGLTSKAFYLPTGERWPSAEEILASGKQLIIFTSFSNNSGSKAYNYVWDHIAEFPYTNLGFPVFEGFYTNGAIENELLMLRDFTNLDQKKEWLPTTWDDLNTNTFLLDHTLKCWKLTGKKPNFIFYSSPKEERAINWLIQMLNPYTSISGSVTLAGKPLKKVSWKHNNQFVTNGYFNFPLTEGYGLELTPFSLGYTFSPATISIGEEKNETKKIEFKALPMLLDAELTGYYDFNNNLKNQLRSNEKHELNLCEYTNDIVRGDVLKIQDTSYVELNKVLDYGIVNSSFTFGIWFKLNKVDDQSDYCILGTSENEYRKGLHINIRNKTPYLGFYNNDVTSFEEIEANKWYHMVIRYNILLGEQSIFINGINTGTSSNHPSFIGESALLLGHSLQMNNYFNGYVDDLLIWKRALSDEEILKLSSTGVSLSNKIQPAYVIFLTILSLILLLFIVFLLFFKRKKNSKNVYIIDQPLLSVNSKNTLLLFGDFTVIDQAGVNISSQFSPKIKEIFLLLFFSTFHSEKGISTQRLTEVIWNGFTTSKASNNRGVTFNKLKKILANVNGLEIIYEDGYWKVLLTKKLNCDYLEIHDLLKQLDATQPENYARLFLLVRNGSFLEGLEWEWLDEYKTNLLFEITDALQVYCKLLKSAKEFEQLYKVTATILKIDDLNEQALNNQLNYLCSKGHHTKSKHLFEQFCERYQNCYGKRYSINFNEFLKMKAEGFV